MKDNPSGKVISGGDTHFASLDARAREIFRHLVDTFINTGSPVGARTISNRPSVDVSPATVRNVMQDLEAAGLLRSPHTSAGRIPTESGLRLFVDTMLSLGEPSTREREAIVGIINSGVMAGRNNEEVYAGTSQIVSGISRCAGLVLTPARAVPIKHIEFVRIEPTRALVVLVTVDEQVENRLISLPLGMPDYALHEAANWINGNLRGLTLGEAATHMRELLEKQQARIDDITQNVVSSGIAAWSESAVPGERNLIVRGRGNLLADQDSLADIDVLRNLLDDMESKRSLIDLLSLAEHSEAVKIFIGSESARDSLSGSSIIAMPFRGSDDASLGVLAVVGPKRMNYAKIIPVVEFSARAMSEIIRSRSGGAEGA